MVALTGTGGYTLQMGAHPSSLYFSIFSFWDVKALLWGVKKGEKEANTLCSGH